jgi:hypothetical protein
MVEVSISVYVIPFGAGRRPQPPGEPVPSVPPVGESDGPPLRYGGFRAASFAYHKDDILENASMAEKVGRVDFWSRKK